MVTKIILVQINFGLKQFLVEQNFWVQKIVGLKRLHPTKFWAQKDFRSEKFFGPLKFWAQKILGL